jgi:transposase
MSLESITEVLAIQGFFAERMEAGDKQIDIWLERDRPEFQCARCGQIHLIAHDRHEVTVQDLPMTGRPVYLHIMKARVRCCGPQPEVERLTWVEKHGYQTVRLKWSIYEECKDSPVKAVAERHILSWDTVKSIDKELIEHRLAKRNLKGLKQLSIDEVAMAKRHKYLTVVTDLQARKVVWVGEGRKSRNLARFFKALPETTRGRIEVVAIDMWKAYRKSVEKWLPNAEVVFDKFHVVAHLSKALDEVRKNEARRLDKDDSKILKRKRWVLLKGAENLSPEQQGTLKDLMDANENLQKAYLLKEEFRDFYRTDFKWHWRRGLFKRIAELARNALMGWVKRAKESLLAPFVKFCRMVERHEEGILRYFVKRVTSGLSEGMNNKIKVVKRRAYGYRDPGYFILKIYQACGKI